VARISTSHNRRLSEMSVDVENLSVLHPLTVCSNSGCGVPHPPHRQAAGRYMTFPLVRCEFIDYALKES